MHAALGCPVAPWWFTGLAGLGAFCVLLLATLVYVLAAEVIQDRVRGMR